MRIKPVFTEKSIAQAKRGNYTFLVDPSLTKTQIKVVVRDTFGVHPISVKTINMPKLKKRTARGKIQIVPARKKAIVALSEKEKIDIFETVTKEEKK